jgi:hypothetical protein
MRNLSILLSGLILFGCFAPAPIHAKPSKTSRPAKIKKKVKHRAKAGRHSMPRSERSYQGSEGIEGFRMFERADVLAEQARAAWARDDDLTAEDLARRAIQIIPHHDIAWFIMGMVALDRHDLAAARKAYFNIPDFLIYKEKLGNFIRLQEQIDS